MKMNLILSIGIIVLLAGCTALEDQFPFGERTTRMTTVGSTAVCDEARGAGDCTLDCANLPDGPGFLDPNADYCINQCKNSEPGYPNTQACEDLCKNNGNYTQFPVRVFCGNLCTPETLSGSLCNDACEEADSKLCDNVCLKFPTSDQCKKSCEGTNVFGGGPPVQYSSMTNQNCKRYCGIAGPAGCPNVTGFPGFTIQSDK